MTPRISTWFALTGNAVAGRLAAIHGEASIANTDGRIPCKCGRRRPLNSPRRDAIRGPPQCACKASACRFLTTPFLFVRSHLHSPQKKELDHDEKHVSRSRDADAAARG